VEAYLAFSCVPSINYIEKDFKYKLDALFRFAFVVYYCNEEPIQGNGTVGLTFV
jgi:hypothetical protein